MDQGVGVGWETGGEGGEDKWLDVSVFVVY